MGQGNGVRKTNGAHPRIAMDVESPFQAVARHFERMAERAGKEGRRKAAIDWQSWAAEYEGKKK
ncbi:MAG: hypothetical protein WD270_01335 [Acetobacterales bacterium]